jgi:hypothetical protein
VQAAAWAGHSPNEHLKTYAHATLTDREEIDHQAALESVTVTRVVGSGLEKWARALDDTIFPPPVQPSALVGDDYPSLKEFVRVVVDMQVADLRLLMQLPQDELDPHVGCNLAATAVILNLVSGFSVWLFPAPAADKIRADEVADGGRKSSRRFKAFVAEYWPRIGPEPAPSWVADRLYEVRNSLSHDLGAYDDPNQREPRSVRLAKSAYRLQDVVDGLERNLVHPLMTVPVVEEHDGTYTVRVAGLYWAMHWMLKKALAADPAKLDADIAARLFPSFEETE